MSGTTPVISFNDVTFTYPSRHATSEPSQPVHRNLTFAIQPGEYVCIVGPNGSGKSTVAKLMTGLLHPDSGSVLLHDKPLLSYFEAGNLPHYVGLVFQDPDLQSVATVVQEDVAFALENLRIDREGMHRRVQEALEQVGMWDMRMREPYALSGGQKQRVAIASVLAPRPSCIIFDEATSMLDSIGRKEVTKLMQDLSAAGHTVISITHHMEEVVEADRVIVLNHGEIAFDLPPAELFRNEEELSSYHLTVPMAAKAANILHKCVSGGDGDQGFVEPDEFAKHLLTRDVTTVHAIGSKDATRQIATPESSEKVVDVAHLYHVYMRNTPMETTSLVDVSFSVQRGEIVSIVGKTGSGKSTLGLHLNGLHRASSGAVQVLQRDAANKRNAKYLRQHVGMLFQKSETQIFETLVGDEIAYGPFRFGASTEEAREAVRQAMELVGLDFSWRDRPTSALSGGERRKVAFASVLAQRPEILVLDEPTSALDPQAQAEMMSLLRRLAREMGMTVIFVTHQLEEVAEIADRVLVMSHGKLVLDSTPDAWLSQPDEVERMGFELPQAPKYVLDICSVKSWPRPETLPLTVAEASVWLSSQLCGSGQEEA